MKVVSVVMVSCITSQTLVCHFLNIKNTLQPLRTLPSKTIRTSKDEMERNQERDVLKKRLKGEFKLARNDGKSLKLNTRNTTTNTIQIQYKCKYNANTKQKGELNLPGMTVSGVQTLADKLAANVTECHEFAAQPRGQDAQDLSNPLHHHQHHHHYHLLLSVDTIEGSSRNQLSSLRALFSPFPSECQQPE